MKESITQQDQTEMRDRLFKELSEIGGEKGFNEVQLTQTTIAQDGQRMEWSIRVVFKKGGRNA